MSGTTLIRNGDTLDTFELPRHLEARTPPETRGLARDEVRLMVSSPDGIHHLRFDELGSVLRPGDLLVVNNSATVPAAVDTDEIGTIHFSTTLPGGLVVVEPRFLAGAGSIRRHDTVPGVVALPGGALLELLTPYPNGSQSGRLWVAAPDLGAPLLTYLARHGRPITYQHASKRFPLDRYQTVFATEPGSAEMPSAGRPFSANLVLELLTAGVTIAPITLHTGVSSMESGEPPYPERYRVSPTTADQVNHTRRSGGRVIAVGTTAVRALQTVADHRGLAHPGTGWTELFIEARHDVSILDGMISGWHEPSSTHLSLLEAVAGRSLLARSYEEAINGEYLWHEFGDSHLILR